MSDIQPGDVVVCVNDVRHALGSCGPLNFPRTWVVKGRYYTVVGIIPTIDGNTLDIAECPQITTGTGWAIERFRKLNDEPDNAELVARIKSCQPIKEGVPA